MKDDREVCKKFQDMMECDRVIHQAYSELKKLSCDSEVIEYVWERFPKAIAEYSVFGRKTPFGIDYDAILAYGFTPIRR
jgi:hypothetical protein